MFLNDLLYIKKANICFVEDKTLSQYIKELKPVEVTEDETVPIKYGLEEQAIENNYKCKKIKFVITYYYADNTPLQGGYLDKYGKELLSYNIPICAAPDDIPYGSIMVLDHPVNGTEEYKIVDTGSAIRWIDSNTCRIDIFVPDARCIKDITSK